MLSVGYYIGESPCVHHKSLFKLYVFQKKKLYYSRLVALIGLLSLTPFYYISNTKKKDSLYDKG